MRVGNNTWRIFYFYLLAYFLVPTVFCFLYPDEFSFLYLETTFFVGLLVIPFVLLIIHLSDFFVPTLRLGFKNPFRHLLANKVIILGASIGYLLVGIWFFKNYSMSFRHQESMSDAGGLAFLLFGFRSWFKAYLLFMIFKHLNGGKLEKFDRLILLLSTVSLALAPVSSFDVIVLATSLFMSVGLERMIFPIRRAKNILIRIANMMKPVLGVLLVVGTVYSGTANKIGTEAANKLIFDKENAELLFVKTVKRASIWVVNVMALTKETENFYEPDMAAETIGGVMTNLRLRFCKLLGTECGTPPKYWSVNRRNFYYVYPPRHWDPRTGSSPGLFGTAFYVPFFPIGVMFVSMYTLWVLRRFSGALFNKNVYIDGIGLFILIFFVSPTFESPIDYINFLSPSFIYALFFFAACSAARELRFEIKVI